MASSNVPEMNPNSIYFPYNEQTNRFHYSFYEEGMTNNQVSKDDVNIFFSGLNQASPNFAEFSKYPKQVKTLMLSTILTLLLGVALIFYGRYSASSNFAVFLGILLIGGSFLLGYQAIVKFVATEEGLLCQTKDHITEYINRNSDGIRNTGLSVKVPEDHFEWIELSVVSGKSKHQMSFQDTTVSLGDRSTRRLDTMFDTTTPKTLLTNLI